MTSQCVYYFSNVFMATLIRYFSIKKKYSVIEGSFPLQFRNLSRKLKMSSGK